MPNIIGVDLFEVFIYTENIPCCLMLHNSGERDDIEFSGWIFLFLAFVLF